VLRLETQRAGGGEVSLPHDAGLLRCLKMSTPGPHTGTASTTTEPLVLFVFGRFDFIAKVAGKMLH